jgi:hypothetical protein
MYYAWADTAWCDVGHVSAPCMSEHYAWGFRDGFAELVYAGGNGEPPAAPPRTLWRAGWRTGPGKQAADDWFAGYRHGATIAREGGYREQAVLRSSAASAAHSVNFEDGQLIDRMPMADIYYEGTPGLLPPTADPLNPQESMPSGDEPTLEPPQSPRSGPMELPSGDSSDNANRRILQDLDIAMASLPADVPDERAIPSRAKKSSITQSSQNSNPFRRTATKQK